MPGNEVGDKVHNFFDQSSSSQDQSRSQFVEANWAGFHNNVWGANERQLGAPLNTSSKNYSEQQSEIERGNNQFSLASHGLNFTHSSVRSEFVKSPSQVQQLNLNGYMHDRQVVNARQNETNFVAVDRGSDRHNMTSRGLSILESQQRNVQKHNNSASFGGAEAPMNFNLLGGQQQMSGQQPGMFQSLPLQQSGMNDTQLMQQQVIFKQMQELQRRQQLQQYEAMQNAMNHMSTFPNQLAGQHSQASNGNSVQETSNHRWQSPAVAGGANWQQPGQPSAVHAHSNGLMVNPEQGQAMRFMGFIPQQASQSLYGVPVSNSGGANPFSQSSMDKPGVFHISTPSSSFSVNPYTPHAEQVSIQDPSTASRSGSEDKTSFEHASSQGLENAVNLGSFNQVQQRKVSMSHVSGLGLVGGSDVFREKSLMQGAASQSITSQATAGLDPTEEKILFGNDDNIWEAFGGASVTGNDGADLFNGVPSLQSGSWSALMQSAVAETSSSDVGTQAEWSGLESQKSRVQSENQHLPTSQDNEKPPPVWVDSSQRASLDWRMTINDVSANNATLNTNYSQNSRLPQLYSNQINSPIESLVLQEGRRWLDRNSPKPHTVENQVLENPNYFRDLSKTDTVFWSHRQSTFLPEPVPDSNVNSKVDFNGPGLNHINISHESSQRPPDNHRLDLCKRVNFATKSGIVGSGNDQHNMNKGQSADDSPVNTPVGEVAEMLGTENGNGRENYNHSHQNSFPNHALSGSLRKNVWSDASDRQFLTEAPEISSGHGGRRVPVVRKFQYHPMGDVDVDESSSAKSLLHSQPMSPSLGLKVHETQPTMLGPADCSSSDIEKGRVSGFHGVKKLHGGLSSSVHPGYLLSTSAPFARSDENSSPNHLSPSQNMLELLHKVDQSNDQNAVSNLGSRSIIYNKSDIPAGGRIGPGQSQPSTSHGFNLQLAPPSQGIALSNLDDPAQSSLRSVGSPSSRIASSESGDKTHAWLASSPSTQCLPPSHRSSQMNSGNDRSGGLDGSQSNLKGSLSASLASNSMFMRNPFQNQHMAAAGGQMVDDHQSSFVSSDRHDQQSTNSQNQAVASQSISNLSNISVSERDGNLSGMRVSMDQMPPSLDAKMSGMRKDNMSSVEPHLWSSQQQLLGIQAHNASDFVKSYFQSNDASDMNVFIQQKKDEPDGLRSTDAVNSPRAAGGEERNVAYPRSSGKTAGVSQDESVGRQSMEASPANSAASQKDVDVFHHSLTPNNTAHQSYPMLHQMQAVKTMDMDPNHRESKRLRGPENGPDAPQMAGKVAGPFTGSRNSMVRDPSASQTSVSSGDSRILGFSPQSGNRNISLLPHGAFDSQDSLSFGRSDSQTFVTGDVTSRAQLTGISPQMAPSWFDQYGTSRNGQLLPVHNLPRVPMVKNVEQQFIKQPCTLVVQNLMQLESAVTDTCQIANTNQITNVYSASEQISSRHALGPPISPNPVTMRPLKRKTVTSDVIPWNKEIVQGFKRIQNISSAEVDWAQSSNRFVERGGDETDFHKDMLPMVGPRRRLILTTKLMQQVFCPPLASILSLDGRSNNELIMYSIARLALGDACNLICGVGSDLSPDNGNFLSEKAKTSEKICDQYFLKVMEDFTNRAKDLENDLLRLDKRASILDFRLDCQDLERFSVINRFARFHGRSQADGGETSSSDANAVSQKPFPQRYVTAHPMPRTVPERVQCLIIN